MENFCITIAREYGSLGRTVGEAVSKRLGIKYYDKNIIRIASEESGINEAFFGSVDEYSWKKPHLLEENVISTGELFLGIKKGLTSDKELFKWQSKVIEELYNTESCVIIGRLGNVVLKDKPKTLSVFVHAPFDFRMKMAKEKLSKTDSEIEKFLKKDDKRKKELSNKFGDGQWDNPSKYDLWLDASQLGEDGCIKAIIDNCKVKGYI